MGGDEVDQHESGRDTEHEEAHGGGEQVACVAHALEAGQAGADPDAEEEREHEPIEDAGHEDAGEAGGAPHPVPPVEGVRADDLAGAEGEDVIGAKADRDDREELVGRDRLDMAQEVVPADRADIQPGKVDGDGGEDEEEIGVAEGVGDPGEIGVAQEEDDEDAADREAHDGAREAPGQTVDPGVHQRTPGTSRVFTRRMLARRSRQPGGQCVRFPRMPSPGPLPRAVSAMKAAATATAPPMRMSAK